MIATFHGHILKEEDLERFLPKDLLYAFPSRLGVPLIVEDELYGFILTNRIENNPEFGQDDYIIAEALMQLFSTSLSNYKSYQDLHEAKLELDEKIFNLFAINQSSKVLLSELNLSNLYSLSIDVFSELTQSSITSFFLYDDKGECFTLRGMKDTFNPNNNFVLSVYPTHDYHLDRMKPILDMNNLEDAAFFNSFFNNIQDIMPLLNPSYIVLLIKNGKLLGFVTLGESITEKPYNKGIFELIESLASSTYIALSNAKYFNETNEQKALLQNKFDRLVSLNHLMKNINSASTVDQLSRLILSTLHISFGIKKGFLALSDASHSNFKILESIGMKNCPQIFTLTENMSCLIEGEHFIVNSKDQLPVLLPKELSDCLDCGSGALFVPICIERIETELLGVIAIFEFSETIISDQESVLIVDTIANHIAPVLYHLNQMEVQSNLLSPNHQNILFKDLESYIVEAEELFMDLEIIHIHSNSFSFNEIKLPDVFIEQFKHFYPISKTDVFIVAFESSNSEDLNLLLPKEYDLSIYKYKKDFFSLEEFKRLFS